MERNKIEEIKERLEKTSKGDWKFGVDGTLHSKETHHHIIYVNGNGDMCMKYVDMTFFENAKTDIAFLISEVERLSQFEPEIEIEPEVEPEPEPELEIEIEIEEEPEEEISLNLEKELKEALQIEKALEESLEIEKEAEMDRGVFSVLGLNLFSYDEALPMDEEVSYTDIRSSLHLFKRFEGMVISITNENEFIIYDGPEIVETMYLQDIPAFRKIMTVHLQRMKNREKRSL